MEAKQCRMARAGLNVSGRDLAKLAGVGYATLARFEAGSEITDETRAKLAMALAQAGAAFSKRASRLSVTVPE